MKLIYFQLIHEIITFTFTFSYLADAFIQSDLTKNNGSNQNQQKSNNMQGLSKWIECKSKSAKDTFFYYKWNLIISLLLNFKQRIAQRFIQSVTFVRFCKMAVHLIEIVILSRSLGWCFYSCTLILFYCIFWLLEYSCVSNVFIFHVRPIYLLISLSKFHFM